MPPHEVGHHPSLFKLSTTVLDSLPQKLQGFHLKYKTELGLLKNYVKLKKENNWGCLRKKK